MHFTVFESVHIAIGKVTCTMPQFIARGLLGANHNHTAICAVAQLIVRDCVLTMRFDVF
jgi:hypothetical protein